MSGIVIDKKISMMWSANVYLGDRLSFAAGFAGLHLTLRISFHSFVDSGKAIDHLEELFPAMRIQVPLKHHYQTP